MKVAYAACDATKPEVRFPDKLVRLFMPSNRRIGRLVKRRRGGSQARVEVSMRDTTYRTSFSSRTESPDSIKPRRRNLWLGEAPLSSVYIPVKEMLANAPGFRALYSARNIHFEEIYPDILDRAFLPPLLGAPDLPRRELLEKLRRALEGKVESKGEEFFLNGRQGKLEFTLLAEGLRKLGLLSPAFLSIDTFLIGLKRAMVIGNSVKQGILCRSFRMPLQAERSVAKANHR